MYTKIATDIMDEMTNFHYRIYLIFDVHYGLRTVS